MSLSTGSIHPTIPVAVRQHVMDKDPANKPLILVADDDPIIRVLSEETLCAAGLDVRCVSDGQQCLDACRSLLPDVVLLDVEMPGPDGFAICREIHASPDTKHIAIIMMTSHDDAKSVNTAYESGAQDFINKPIPWAVLPHRVQYVLAARRAFTDLQNSERRNRLLLKAIPDRISIVSGDGELLEYLSGADPAFPIGSRVENVFPPEKGSYFLGRLRTAIATGELQTFEFESPYNGKYVEARLVAQRDKTVMVIIRDITDRKHAEEKVRHLAYHDSLTGLPNRQHFANRLRRALDHAKRTDQRLAIMYLDLDRFKRINDTLGRKVGDALLRAVAKRLEHSVRESDAVARINKADEINADIARLGGDEFVSLITDVKSEEQVISIAERIRRKLTSPFHHNDHQFIITPSIGIALFPRDGQNTDDLLMSADLAMHEAKSAGSTSCKFYSGSMNLRSIERLDLETDLQQAIINNDFQLHYQPKIDLMTAKITGVEALLRWKHPQKGWISPEQFIPVAEETGLIVQLGNWVIKSACEQIRDWHQDGIVDINVAINVSSRQFCHGDLLNTIMKSLVDTGVTPDCLEVEITESLLMRDIEQTITTLESLKNAGLQIAIDDFGTGYSSLSYLKQFPLDALKIDRTFVRDLHQNRDDAAICAAILAMAKELDLNVIAEGVELQDQLEFLREHGCDQVQGFLFSKAVCADELVALLHTGIDHIYSPGGKGLAEHQLLQA